MVGAVPLMKLLHHHALPEVLFFDLLRYQMFFALTCIPTNTQHQLCSTLSSPYLQGPSKPLATPFGQVNSFRLDHVLTGPHVVDFCKSVDCRCANACAVKVGPLRGGMLVLGIIFEIFGRNISYNQLLRMRRRNSSLNPILYMVKRSIKERTTISTSSKSQQLLIICYQMMAAIRQHDR